MGPVCCRNEEDGMRTFKLFKRYQEDEFLGKLRILRFYNRFLGITHNSVLLNVCMVHYQSTYQGNKAYISFMPVLNDRSVPDGNVYIV